MTRIFQAPPHYDANAIVDLIKVSFSEQIGRVDPPSSAHELRSTDVQTHLDAHIVWVIEHQKRPIACLFAAPLCCGSLYLSKLSVHPHHRRKGLARALLQAAQKTARNMRLSCVKLISRPELCENHTLFKQCGFEKYDERSHAGYARITEFHFRKTL